jgi:hypothetical protein
MPKTKSCKKRAKFSLDEIIQLEKGTLRRPDINNLPASTTRIPQPGASTFSILLECSFTFPSPSKSIIYLLLIDSPPSLMMEWVVVVQSVRMGDNLRKKRQPQHSKKHRPQHKLSSSAQILSLSKSVVLHTKCLPQHSKKHRPQHSKKRRPQHKADSTTKYRPQALSTKYQPQHKVLISAQSVSLSTEYQSQSSPSFWSILSPFLLPSKCLIYLRLIDSPRSMIMEWVMMVQWVRVGHNLSTKYQLGSKEV